MNSGGKTLMTIKEYMKVVNDEIGLCHVNQEKHMSDWRRPAMPAG